jgi:hypothetical protein
MHTAAQVIAEREVWNFAEANPNIDVTSSTFTFYSISKLFLPCVSAQFFQDSHSVHMAADRPSICTVLARLLGSPSY